MGTAFKQLTDLAYSTLDGAIDATQNYFACQAADESRFTNTTADFIVTIGDPGEDGLYASGREDVLVAARTGVNFTSCTRSYNGTTAPVGGWADSTPIRVNWLTAHYNALATAINALEDEPELSALAALTSAADKLPYFTGSGTADVTSITPFARTLLDDTTAAAMRTTLGVQAAGSYQPLDATLTALAGVGAVADRLPYFNGSDTATVTTLTSFARTLLDDATAAAARTTLELVPGVNVQAYDAELAALAGLTSAADKAPYFTGSGTAALMDVTAFARTILDDADASTARATLGVAIGTNVQAWDAQLDDIAALAVTDGNIIVGDGTHWVVESGATARASLGLTIGTHVQAYDAELAALAGLTSAADSLPYFTGSGTAALTTLTSAARSILDDATVGDIRTTIGVGTADSPTFAGVSAASFSAGSLVLRYPGTRNIVLGEGAFASSVNAYYNIAIGYTSLMSTTNSNRNIAIGDNTLKFATTASYNVAIGYDALYSLTTGDSGTYVARNVAVGWRAMHDATVSAWCTACGTEALASLTTASFNTAVGYQALYLNTTGNSNTAIGVQSQWKNIGLRNVTVGNDTMHAEGATGSHNVAMGYAALLALTSGYGNTCLGYGAADNLTTGSYNIVMGHDLDVASATADYQLNIGGIITASAYNSGAGATLNLVAGTIASGLAALTLFNTTTTTVNAFGAATSLYMGSSAGCNYYAYGSLYMRNGAGIAMRLGADSDAVGTLTDSKTKAVRVGLVHYTNTEEPVGLIYATSSSSNNTLLFGGGSYSLNAATNIHFYTAENTTTTTGTERLRINSAGLITVRSGTLDVGVTHDTAAVLNLYGNSTTSGPKIVMYNAASEDDTHDAFTIEANGAYLDIGTGTTAACLRLNDMDLSATGGDITAGGFIAGADGTTQGNITLWDGSGGNKPGFIKIHSPNGTGWYLFVEDDGTVKVHNASPTANTDGSVVGSQT